MSLVAAVAKTLCQNNVTFSRRGQRVVAILYIHWAFAPVLIAQGGLFDVIPADQVHGQLAAVPRIQELLNGRLIPFLQVPFQLIPCRSERRPPQQMRHKRDILFQLDCGHL